MSSDDDDFVDVAQLFRPVGQQPQRYAQPHVQRPVVQTTGLVPPGVLRTQLSTTPQPMDYTSPCHRGAVSHNTMYNATQEASAYPPAYSRESSTNSTGPPPNQTTTTNNHNATPPPPQDYKKQPAVLRDLLQTTVTRIHPTNVQQYNIVPPALYPPTVSDVKINLSSPQQPQPQPSPGLTRSGSTTSEHTMQNEYSLIADNNNNNNSQEDSNVSSQQRATQQQMIRSIVRQDDVLQYYYDALSGGMYLYNALGNVNGSLPRLNDHRQQPQTTRQAADAIAITLRSYADLHAKAVQYVHIVLQFATTQLLAHRKHLSTLALPLFQLQQKAAMYNALFTKQVVGVAGAFVGLFSPAVSSGGLPFSPDLHPLAYHRQYTKWYDTIVSHIIWMLLTRQQGRITAHEDLTRVDVYNFLSGLPSGLARRAMGIFHRIVSRRLQQQAAESGDDQGAIAETASNAWVPPQQSVDLVTTLHPIPLPVDPLVLLQYAQYHDYIMSALQQTESIPPQYPAEVNGESKDIKTNNNNNNNNSALKNHQGGDPFTLLPQDKMLVTSAPQRPVDLISFCLQNGHLEALQWVINAHYPMYTPNTTASLSFCDLGSNAMANKANMGKKNNTAGRKTKTKETPQQQAVAAQNNTTSLLQ